MHIPQAIDHVCTILYLLLQEVSKNSKNGHDGYRTALSRRVIGNTM